MNWLRSYSCLGLLATFLLILVGCSREEEESKKPFTLPGADKVLTALQAKDYEGVVSGLAEIKSKLTETERPEYRRLLSKVTDQLVNEIGADSEPAKEAYRAIGMMETGR